MKIAVFLLSLIAFVPQARAQGINIGSGFVSGPSIDDLTPEKRRKVAEKHRKMARSFVQVAEYLENLKTCTPFKYSANNIYNEHIKEDVKILGWDAENWCAVTRTKKYPVGKPVEFECSFSQQCIDIFTDDRLLYDLRNNIFSSEKIRGFAHEIYPDENVKKCYEIMCKEAKKGSKGSGGLAN